MGCPPSHQLTSSETDLSSDAPEHEVVGAHVGGLGAAGSLRNFDLESSIGLIHSRPSGCRGRRLTDMKRTTRSRLSAVAAVGPLLLAVVLAACGSGSGSSGSGAGVTSLTQFCNDGRSILSTIPSVLSGDSSLAPPGKAELTSYAVQLRKLAGEAPAQIKGDLTTTAAFFEQASLNGIGAVDSTTTSNAQAAADRLHTFGSQNCGSGSSTPTASTGTASGWSSSPIERTDVRMKGVSCASAPFCVAFDEIYQAFIYNGTSWSKTGGQMALVSVSCPSATFCVALSSCARAPCGIGNAFIYNGTSWLSSPIGPYNYGNDSVSCPN